MKAQYLFPARGFMVAPAAWCPCHTPPKKGVFHTFSRLVDLWWHQPGLCPLHAPKTGIFPPRKKQEENKNGEIRCAESPGLRDLRRLPQRAAPCSETLGPQLSFSESRVPCNVDPRFMLTRPTSRGGENPSKSGLNPTTKRGHPPIKINQLLIRG